MMAVILETRFGMIAPVVVVVDDDDGRCPSVGSSDDKVLSIPPSAAAAAAYSGSLCRLSSRQDGDDGAIFLS
jgi:hypothetical protein